MNIVIVGAGINGLVAANYLKRFGHAVTIVERKPQTGGACCRATFKEYTYPPGASVFGLMPDFIYKDTGLNIQTFIPPEPDVFHFPGHEPLYEDDLRNESYLRDLTAAANLLKQSFREAKVIKDIPSDLEMWFKGSAKQVFDHYFTSKLAKLAQSIPVVESGPVPLDSPFSAFTLVVMNAGGFRWGFPVNGIWEIPKQLTKINLGLGINIITEAKSIPAADLTIFATDPITASRLSGVEIEEKKYIGDSGKQIMFFKKPIRWKHSDGFQFVFTADDVFFEVYPEGTSRRRAGWQADYDYCCIFFKMKGKEQVEKSILGLIDNPEDYVESVVFCPDDLRDMFFFPQGNIDHMELCEGQTLWARTFSKNPDKFYQFGDRKDVYYCGAGAYPCGSVAGTPGYMCAMEIGTASS